MPPASNNNATNKEITFPVNDRIHAPPFAKLWGNIDGRDVTPVPGGVGLLTRAALLDNVISAREFKEKNINE